MLTQYNVERSAERLALIEEKAYDYPDKAIAQPMDYVDLLNTCFHLDRLVEEHMVMVVLTAKMKPVALFETGRGTATRCLFSPRELYLRALLCGGIRIIVAHNHVSGDPTPSQEDLAAYRRIKEAGDVIGIHLTDFLIIGSGGLYYSYKEHTEN